MEFLKKIFGGSKKKDADKGDMAAKAPKKAAEGKNYEEGAQALSAKNKVGPEQFKKNVREAVAAGMTRERFDQLCAQYRSLGNLEKYAVSSWMAAEYPELDQTIRSGDYELYQTLKGG